MQTQLDSEVTRRVLYKNSVQLGYQAEPPVVKQNTHVIQLFKKAKGSIPISVAIVFVILLFGLLGLVHVLEGRLPKPLTVIDEKSNPDAFITERAKHDLKLLTSLGPRVTGSYENEVLTISFFKREISFIQQLAHPNKKIEVDFQTVSGSFFVDYKPHSAISAYSNIQNVVVKLQGRNGAKETLLLNSHFDTVPTSPGGSDDGINCVVMLEILRKLSRSPYPLYHNIIFLFNGAEETGLNGAHGFITKHKWAKDIKAVINLEGAGAGGKEHLFQTGNDLPWLLDYFSHVPHPKGNVLSEEIFHYGLIPSDTDFRVFRDYGNVTGLDFAFIDDGYRYHTKYDGFENIPDGSYQHIGDNILKLTNLIGNSSEMSYTTKYVQKMVFYDFFGFFITYNERHATIINMSIIFLSIAISLRSFYMFGLRYTRESVAYISVIFGSLILGWFTAGFFALITAITLDFLKSTLSWYGHQWILLGLYAFPTVVCCCTTHLILCSYKEKIKFNIHIQSQIQIHVTKLMWTLLLLIGTCFGIRSMYLILIPLIFQTISCGALQIPKVRHSVNLWQWVYVIILIIPIAFLMQVFETAIRTLIPVCGRIGVNKNPELLLGMFTFMCTAALSSLYVPLIILVRKPFILVRILLAVFALVFIIAITPLGFPYSTKGHSPTPQRYWIFHTSRTFRNDTNHIYKKNAGFFIMNWDRNAPHILNKYVTGIRNAKPISEDCDTYLFCGLPLTSSRIVGLLQDSTWIPAGQPIVHEPVVLKMLEKNKLSNTITQFKFSVTGPSHVYIAVSARPGVNLVNTNLVPKLPNPLIWNNRITYIILHTWGTESTPLLISLDFEVPLDWNKPTFDIVLSGKCMHDRINLKTPQYIKFLNSFPNWTDVVPYLATYESWVY